MTSKHLHTVTAYSGAEPYVFVSFAHSGSDRVLPYIKALQLRGYRIWLDVGIEAGTEWSANIAQHLRECAVVLAFVSAAFARSENCQDEIAYAKSNQKPTLLVYLEDQVALPEGMEMQTARFQRMFTSRQRSTDEFVDRLNQSGIFDGCIGDPAAPADQPKAPGGKKLLVTVIAIVAALVLLLALLIAAFGGSDAPEETETTTATVPETTEVTTPETTQATVELVGVPFYSIGMGMDGLLLRGAEYELTLAGNGHSPEQYAIEFRADGTGIITLEGQPSGFTYDETHFWSSRDPENRVSYILENGELTIDFQDYIIIFAR